MALLPWQLTERRAYAKAINAFSDRYGLGFPHITALDAVTNTAKFVKYSRFAQRILGYAPATIGHVPFKQATSDLLHPSNYLNDPKRAGKAGNDRHAAELKKWREPHGDVVISLSANLPGRPIHAKVLADCQAVAAKVGWRITIICGTNHCQYVNCDPSNNVSDHWAGNAADLDPHGQDDGPDGTKIAAACMEVGGWSARAALQNARAGGEFVNEHSGYRYDVLWKTDIGGDHHNHIHFGIRPL